MSPRYENILDRNILSLSATDFFRLRDLVEGGTLITGGLGAGKSSTSLRQLFLGFLRQGMGALICTVKSEDTANYLALAQLAGREKDVQVYNIESALTFDCIAYLWSTGRGAGDVEAVIVFFNVILAIGKPNLGDGESRFWQLACEQVMRHSLHLLKLAGKTPSVIEIYKTIQSFPTWLGEHEEEAWRKASFTASLIEAIEARKETLTESEWADLEVATQFIFAKWSACDPKLRSSVEMTFSGMADRFTFSPARELFCSGAYSFTPEQITHEGKILILDFPPLALGRETARLMQVMLKLVFQRAWLRHPYVPGCCNGAALIQDEFQILMSRFENHFVQVCRSSAIAPVFCTQTILNLAEEMGESQPGSKTKAFLNNLSVKIAHNSTCPENSTYHSDVIGKTYRYIENFSASMGEQNHAQTSVGGSLQLVHTVDPIEFSRLARPDGNSPYAAAIVHSGGKTFNATKTERNPQGTNYLRVMFSRE